MRVRLIESGDHDEWLRMRMALWPECSAVIHNDEMASSLMHLSETPVFVAERDAGGLCGFLEARLRPYADGCDPATPVGYIEGWYVDPEVRRKGVGRVLVEMAEAWAILNGCQEMGSDCVIDDRVSLTAHLSLGYQESGRLIHFRKSLQQTRSSKRRK